MFTIKRSVILFIILIVFTGCDQPKREKQSVDQASLKEAKFQIKTYQSDSGGYGYDVFVNATRMIHQPNIPGQELRDSI
ncbi:putative lipoprotein [Leptospira kirschneri str. 200803703]|uniref:Lipoprotein n=1 Tax=Leptospira kirschneri str. 200802841 TaxID=1193047 RepID=A0A828Y813_9LEPT|nr:putative lipoprotein [Leptospira kirschneri str. 200802841]EKP06824.1 putative lipoprotein [Leptospira kirschneri str. 2008720114]EMK12269.1 putative lipoprotein [Leptospira kirschneri serovar Bim str. PUO 1247]EMN04641.1 putative lipoprotein [Leptospira kirschneri serovar Bim str. 1051]EMN27018.1 putative lipoprotein [Leptospira kirschneri serovar Sokoine str. RM1]EMO67187.1 putative lipoprotein [Leptospira kirschneri str. 200803703]EMO78197.1 putative lipoprotein [Leptospira kirschneri s